MRILARTPRMVMFMAGSLFLAGGAYAQPAASLATLEIALPITEPARTRMEPAQARGPDLSVMTYNVKGLPWPIATGRADALERIADRLARMRKDAVQPAVVVLQEAFRSEAKSIGDRAGYRYQIVGARAQRVANPVSRRAPLRRRSAAPQLDSGLIVLSDFPIVEVDRAAFPKGACAGMDCFAAKGVVLVTLDVPGKGRVEIATTHLNSKGASWAPEKETERAYREQVDFLVDFLRSNRNPAIPLILAGDFNLGDREERLAILPPALTRLNGGLAPSEALRGCIDADFMPDVHSDDAQWVLERARDMQYVLPGDRRTVAAVAASIPFGTETGGEPLSDHFGYTIEYRLTAPAGMLASRDETPVAARPNVSVASMPVPHRSTGQSDEQAAIRAN